MDRGSSRWSEVGGHRRCRPSLARGVGRGSSRSSEIVVITALLELRDAGPGLPSHAMSALAPPARHGRRRLDLFHLVGSCLPPGDGDLEGSCPSAGSSGSCKSAASRRRHEGAGAEPWLRAYGPSPNSNKRRERKGGQRWREQQGAVRQRELLWSRRRELQGRCRDL